jgi:hypothetical protein
VSCKGRGWGTGPPKKYNKIGLSKFGSIASCFPINVPNGVPNVLPMMFSNEFAVHVLYS